jgi:hypothetical protein
MSVSTVIKIDLLRSEVYTGISGSYVAVGVPFVFPVRLICFTNNTDGDMILSDDGVHDKLFIPAASFKLFDVTTNRNGNSPSLCFQTYTQFYVKQSTVPTKGAVYIECLG